jgi:hypothetical protein
MFRILLDLTGRRSRNVPTPPCGKEAHTKPAAKGQEQSPGDQKTSRKGAKAQRKSAKQIRRVTGFPLFSLLPRFGALA